MKDELSLLVSALYNHIRVNVDLHTIEIYDEYGVKTVLRDLDEATYRTFLSHFKKY